MGIASLIYGAFYSATAASSIEFPFILRALRNIDKVDYRFWLGPIGNVFDIIVGLVVVSGAATLMRGGSYQLMFKALRMVILLRLFQSFGLVMNGRIYLQPVLLVLQAAYVAKDIAFPGLIILLLLVHRHDHPSSVEAGPLPPVPLPPLIPF